MTDAALVARRGNDHNAFMNRIVERFFQRGMILQSGIGQTQTEINDLGSGVNNFCDGLQRHVLHIHRVSESQ